jgi:hypothetical protein
MLNFNINFPRITLLTKKLNGKKFFFYIYFFIIYKVCFIVIISRESKLRKFRAVGEKDSLNNVGKKKLNCFRVTEYESISKTFFSNAIIIHFNFSKVTVKVYYSSNKRLKDFLLNFSTSRHLSESTVF